MALGLVGQKLGMTRVFTEDGESVPVTVLHVTPNRISQIKTEESDGYAALQLAAGSASASGVSKPQTGHFAKSGVEPVRTLREFRLDDGETEGLELGKELSVEIFTAGQKVDVTGLSKGKGYAGTIKRHNFRGQDNTHGNSVSHRVPGSVGQCQTPGRVFKGKKMSGHLGNVRTTTQNLEIVKVDSERNLLLIKGAVPGSKSGIVAVTPAAKAGE
ncbi:MAG: 50S ribosomal protein L3 [Gammaproteobacteria bacterium]|jgi:large subunit ribosomal protein L3|nr:50S ribosomal protein L3 [Gammaproteobacteria bacterium]